MAAHQATKTGLKAPRSAVFSAEHTYVTLLAHDDYGPDYYEVISCFDSKNPMGVLLSGQSRVFVEVDYLAPRAVYLSIDDSVIHNEDWEVNSELLLRRSNERLQQALDFQKELRDICKKSSRLTQEMHRIRQQSD